MSTQTLTILRLGVRSFFITLSTFTIINYIFIKTINLAFQKINQLQNTDQSYILLIIFLTIATMTAQLLYKKNNKKIDKEIIEQISTAQAYHFDHDPQEKPNYFLNGLIEGYLNRRKSSTKPAII